MKALILALTLFFSVAFSGQYTLSVGAIFQDEAPYLQEWLEYHQAHGVEHFWLYNNCSTDGYLQVLYPWIASGVVELIEWGKASEKKDFMNFVYITQIGAYNDALKRSRGVSKWLGLIDIDEFIVCQDHGSIAQFLEKDYSHCSGLLVNWQCYGTGHRWESPLMLRDVQYKLPEQHAGNMVFKSIVQPLHVTDCPSPHLCNYLPIHWAVNSSYERCHDKIGRIDVSKIRINHYWARDEKYMSEKKFLDTCIGESMRIQFENELLK